MLCYGVYWLIMISSNNPLPTTPSSYGTHPTSNRPMANCRRIIRCLIELNRPGDARDHLLQIKESPINVLTLVLQFQVSLRCDDEALGDIPLRLTLMIATKALEQLTTAQGFVPQMLYLCALDAQAQGKKELGFTVLKKILRHYNDDFMTDEAKKEIRLPVLFRYPPRAPRGLI